MQTETVEVRNLCVHQGVLELTHSQRVISKQMNKTVEMGKSLPYTSVGNEAPECRTESSAVRWWNGALCYLPNYPSL